MSKSFYKVAGEPARQSCSAVGVYLGYAVPLCVCLGSRVRYRYSS